MLIKMVSQLSGKEHTRDIDITEEQLKRLETDRTHIQTQLPHLSPDDREFLMTGITPEEWNETFGEDEDDEIPSGRDLNFEDEDDYTGPVDNDEEE